MSLFMLFEMRCMLPGCKQDLIEKSFPVFHTATEIIAKALVFQLIIQ